MKHIAVRHSLLVLMAAAALCSGGCGDLPVTPAGCETVLSGAVCEVGQERQLRLFVESVPDSQVTVLQSLRPLPLKRTRVDGGTLLRLTVRPGVRELRVIERVGWHLRTRVVPVRESQTESWLRDARGLWESDKVIEAERLLAKGLGSPSVPRTRAEALGMLGRIRREQLRNPEAKELLTSALAADREAGLLSNEAKDTFALAALLVQDEYRVHAAEELLSARTCLFEKVPDLQPWVHLHWATYRKLQGDLQGALESVEEGRKLAIRLGEEQALGSLRQSAATLLQALGRWAEARDELVGLAGELAGQPCLQANALEMQGWLEIGAQETKQLGAEKLQPENALERALHLRRDRCNQGRPIVLTLTNLARAALQTGDVKKATHWLHEARTMLPAPDLSLQEQWVELSGAMALARTDTATAERRYRELLQLSQTAPEPRDQATKGASRDLYDTAWRAHIGLARTLRKAQRPAEAEQSFQQAEAFLDRRSLEIPLAEGRVSYLGRHEQGTAAYLELLYEQKRYAAAFNVLRIARARGLRTLLRLADPGRLSSEQQQRWQDAVKQYREQRAKLDANATLRADAVISEARIHAEERRRLELKLARALDAAFAVLDNQREQALREPDPEEALLGCHPLPDGWLCLVARGPAAIQAVRLRGDIAEQGAQLVAAISESLKGAERLTVLSYGPQMDGIDFGLLPLSGRPLEEAMNVVYGLDLPSQPASAASQGAALLAIDPTNGYSESWRPQLAPLLRQEPGWRVEEITNQKGRVREQLLHLLGAAELFVYFGHAQVESQVSRRFLQTDEKSGLQAMDILMLQSVPGQVVLIACESGLAKEGSGGVAGLGLAQAFLLRGSRSVIATTRKVHGLIGKVMAEELLQGGAAALLYSPASRLRAARKAVEAGPARGQAWIQDTRAFRIYTP